MEYKYTYTFIIPHKDTPILLYRCLSSIPQRKDIQIIIVDDNSQKENLKDIQEHISGNNIEIITLDHSKGAGYARNVGISKAKGKWLLFTDADDFYLDNFIFILDKYKNSDNDILYFSVCSIDSITLKPANRAKDYDYFISLYDKNIPNSADYIKYKKWEPWNKMLSHKFILKHNIKFEEISKCNDMIFSILSSYYAKDITIIPDKIYCVTYNNNSITYRKTSSNAFIDSIIANKKKNFMMEYIGRKNWKESILKKHLYYLKKEGILSYCKLLIEYFKKYNSTVSELNEFYNKIKKETQL